MRDLETGIVHVNAPTIGAEIASPLGQEETPAMATVSRNRRIDFYSEWKTLYIDYSDRLHAHRSIPPITGEPYRPNYGFTR